MWLQKNKGKYYWYYYENYYAGIHDHGIGKYVRPATWWEVILYKLFKKQP